MVNVQVMASGYNMFGVQIEFGLELEIRQAPKLTSQEGCPLGKHLL